MISWFAKNDVAANLMLIFIVFIGLYTTLRVLPLESFPIVDPRIVSINVVQRGATPADIESGITLKIEEAISDYEVIEEIISKSNEGNALVMAKLKSRTDKQVALNDIKSRIDALSTLPAAAEKPIITASDPVIGVIQLVIYGDISEKELTLLARKLETEIIAIPGISQTSIQGVRPYEISINVSQATLREYGLSIDDITQSIRLQSIDISAGQLRTDSGDILLVSNSQAYRYADYASINVATFPDGSELRLDQIAEIDDGFDENPVFSRFNNQRAAIISISRTGSESAIEIAEKVNDYIVVNRSLLPDGVEMISWDDQAVYIKDRINTLLTSGLQGGILVFILLALLLRIKVALWVVVGIPVCYAGSLALLPYFGVTINGMSVFGFILVLGVVVDDAIVTGENIYTHFKRHGDGLRAAIEGTQEVAKPVTFGILTTMAAFAPLCLIDAGIGALMQALAFVVIGCLIFSLVESKLILPAHLKNMKTPQDRESSNNKFTDWLRRTQDKISNSMVFFAKYRYQPVLTKAVNNRYFTLTCFICLLVLMIFGFKTGVVKFSPFPRVGDTIATAKLSMPQGTPANLTEQSLRIIQDAAVQAGEKYTINTTGESSVKGVLVTLGISEVTMFGEITPGAANLGNVSVAFHVDGEQPVPLNPFEFVREWRDLTGEIPSSESLQFAAEAGDFGDPVDIKIISNNEQSTNSIVAFIERELRQFDGVYDVNNSFSNGKRELQIELKPEGHLLGLDLQDVAVQVRNAFFGSEAQRIQRNRDDIRVMVKYPLSERSTLNQLEDLMLITSDNRQTRFADVATVSWGRAPSAIDRIDLERSVNVTADIDKTTVDQAQLSSDIEDILVKQSINYPDVKLSQEGEQADAQELLFQLLVGLGFTLLIIYTLLAIPFKSYSQPVIVMSAIPFSIIGAVLGHLIIGFTMSMVSIFGVLALIGIIVNDSLVMVHWINQRVDEGMALIDAVCQAGAARFRAIILTSITTFVGILPILFDTSTQGQFLIPMVTSIGFGVLFGSLLTLFLVPCNYMILEDIKSIFRSDKSETKKPAPQLQNSLDAEI